MKRLQTFVRAAFVVSMAVAILSSIHSISAQPSTIIGQGKVKGAITLVVSEAPNAQANLNLAGTASHIGKFTIQGSGAVSFNGTRYVQTAPAVFIVTDANGDSLLGTFDYDLNWVPGTYELSGRAEINAGTGRYFGYAGHADFLGIVNGLTGQINESTFDFYLEKTVAGKTIHGSGQADGTSVITPQAGGVLGIVSLLNGTASHLGKVKIQLNSAGTVVNGTPTPVPPSTMTITTANGDLIQGTFKWLHQQLGALKFEVYGPFTITGGTGAYQNVTGSGTYRGVLDILAGTNKEGSFEFDLLIPRN